MKAPVFAVGNGGGKCKTSVSPADYEGVVGVGATNKQDTLLEFSSRGPATNQSKPSNPLPYNPLTPLIVAPGLNIRGPAKDGDGYHELSGTSQAAPHVAGTIALCMSMHPDLSAKEAADMVIKAAETSSLQEPDGSTDCGGIAWNVFPNYVYGHGRVDALQICASSA